MLLCARTGAATSALMMNWCWHVYSMHRLILKCLRCVWRDNRMSAMCMNWYRTVCSASGTYSVYELLQECLPLFCTGIGMPALCIDFCCIAVLCMGVYRKVCSMYKLILKCLPCVWTATWLSAPFMGWYRNVCSVHGMLLCKIVCSESGLLQDCLLCVWTFTGLPALCMDWYRITCSMYGLIQDCLSMYGLIQDCLLCRIVCSV